MKRKRNIQRQTLYIILIVICLFIASLSIAYSALSTILNVSGVAKMNQANWDIHFDNVKIEYGSVGALKNPTITAPNQIDFAVELDKPGDFFIFTVDIVNNGSIDAMIDGIIKSPQLTPEQQKYFTYDMIYSDGNSVGMKQLLESKKQKKIKVRIAYKTDLIASDLPKNPDSLNLSFQAIFTQANESAIIGPEGPGIKIPKTVRVLQGEGNKIGDKIAIKDEEFYVIDSNAETTTLFAVNKLYVGGEFDTNSFYMDNYYDNYNSPLNYKNNKSYKVQRLIAAPDLDITNDADLQIALQPYKVYFKEYGKKATNIQEKNVNYWDYGLVPFSVNNTKGVHYEDYQGSLVEKYVNNYRKILESYNVKINNARLINMNDLQKLGCTNNGCQTSIYEWLLDTEYWIDIKGGDNALKIINYEKNFTNISYCFDDLTMWFYSRGVRPVIEIPTSLITMENITIPDVRLGNMDIDNPNIGDKFYLRNEGFYVIDSDATTITGLAEYNLYVGGIYDYETNSYIPFPRSQITGLQNSKMTGLKSNQDNSDFGVVQFGPTNSYVGSHAERYVNDYKYMLEQFGFKINTAQLLTGKQLAHLGCDINKSYCLNQYDWIYSSGYWLMDKKYSDFVYMIRNDDKMGAFINSVYVNNYNGIRPVITIDKNELKNHLNSSSNDNDIYDPNSDPK